MPVIDGARVYQALQADAATARIPVIVSTSSPGQAPAGVVVVPKPLKLDRLLDAVAALWNPEAG
jgi:CheY-like chemotaxis protein